MAGPPATWRRASGHQDTSFPCRRLEKAVFPPTTGGGIPPKISFPAAPPRVQVRVGLTFTMGGATTIRTPAFSRWFFSSRHPF